MNNAAGIKTNLLSVEQIIQNFIADLRDLSYTFFSSMSSLYHFTFPK